MTDSIAGLLFYAAALVGAVATLIGAPVLLVKALRRGARQVALMEELLAQVKRMSVGFPGDSVSWEVLTEIVKQLRNDSGTTVLDMIQDNALAMVRLVASVDKLISRGELDRELDERSREEFSRLVLALDRVATKVDAGGATGLRIEAEAGHVADQLAAAQQRADEVIGDPGAQADEAARSPEETA